MLDSNMNQEVLSAAVIDPEQPCVLVLAAGRGERFLASGGSSHKLQAMLGLQTVLQTTLAAVQASGLPWHLEYGPHPGMGDSIAAAVKATAGANGWLVLPADLPLIQASTLQQLALQLAQLESRELRVIQPFYQGQKGHPVAFSRAAAQELAELSGDLGAASIVRNAAENQRLRRWDCDDIGCVLDVDTVQALEEARRIWQARNS
ncbi:nucleotidyltransferase family protein [Comamonas thiooxydans]|uniref:nucleotidyltransferase family protein n=1 Tax=Comamonas thiooxydans TaxID=363952 RepID=UPI001CCD7704|nr:NTP transferase domain-containing protein [Comamonas thiooxydans]MCO8249864.1 NTP transferase domain-containing protein [Comamonas thiooxydans]UBQ44202.1 NTP transferase domain-containing protein [Comamonas thiooxydans]